MCGKDEQKANKLTYYDFKAVLQFRKSVQLVADHCRSKMFRAPQLQIFGDVW